MPKHRTVQPAASLAEANAPAGRQAHGDSVGGASACSLPAGAPVHCGMGELPDHALAQVAGFFQLLAEPSRLRVLNLLREQPQCVGELARACGSSAANISRHLAQLQRHGLVHREERGTSVYYAMADPSVYALCELVCGQLARQQVRLDESRASFLKPQDGKPEAPEPLKS